MIILRNTRKEVKNTSEFDEYRFKIQQISKESLYSLREMKKLCLESGNYLLEDLDLVDKNEVHYNEHILNLLGVDIIIDKDNDDYTKWRQNQDYIIENEKTEFI